MTPPSCRVRPTCPPCTCAFCLAQRRREARAFQIADALAWVLGLSAVLIFACVTWMAFR